MLLWHKGQPRPHLDKAFNLKTTCNSSVHTTANLSELPDLVPFPFGPKYSAHPPTSESMRHFHFRPTTRGFLWDVQVPSLIDDFWLINQDVLFNENILIDMGICPFIYIFIFLGSLQYSFLFLTCKYCIAPWWQRGNNRGEERGEIQGKKKRKWRKSEPKEEVKKKKAGKRRDESEWQWTPLPLFLQQENRFTSVLRHFSVSLHNKQKTRTKSKGAFHWLLWFPKQRANGEGGFWFWSEPSRTPSDNI